MTLGSSRYWNLLTFPPPASPQQCLPGGSVLTIRCLSESYELSNTTQGRTGMHGLAQHEVPLSLAPLIAHYPRWRRSRRYSRMAHISNIIKKQSCDLLMHAAYDDMAETYPGTVGYPLINS
jgi:hypothetical protein